MTAEALSAGRTRAAAPSRGPARRALERFTKHRAAVASAVILAVMVLACTAAPLAAQVYGGFDQPDLFNRLQGPTWAHPLGTDELGRDVLVRLLYGGQVSLLVGLATALVAAVIGTAVGLVSGYVGGAVDAVLMRVTDTVIALPLLPFLIILAALDLAELGVPSAVRDSEWISLYRIITIIALFGWTTVARLVRASVLSVKERDYVRAARALGAGPVRIMRHHILPNVVSPILVATTLSVGNIILVESVLSFLGVGIQPPMPSWGNMVTNAQDLVNSAPHLALMPGVMIFTTVIAFNFLGDGLQEAADPRAEIDT